MPSHVLKNPLLRQQFIYCYLIFIINGMLALSVGLILPFVRDTHGLTYAFAGILISFHSIGYLIASFTAGILPLKIGKKKSALFFNSALGLSFLLLLITTQPALLLLAFTLTGVARGSTSNFATAVINSIAPGAAWAINGLHAMFAIGAFTLPLLLTFLTNINSGHWVYLLVFMLAMGVLSWLLFFFMPLSEDTVKAKKNNGAGFGFLKSPVFYLVTGTLFFYLCAEQGVIGWLVTYFRNTELLSDGIAQLMSSVLWMMILVGRLSTAWLSTRVAKGKLLFVMGVGLVLFFTLLMLSSTPLWIFIGVMGFGLSMSGIYGTTVTYASDLMKNFALTWSFILTFASLGSITMPTIIGTVAHHAGIHAGMATITIAVFIALCFICSLLIYAKKQEI